MPKPKPSTAATVAGLTDAPQLPAPRKPAPLKADRPQRIRGRFAPGWSGNPNPDPGRARRELNADTIREMHRAFREGGRKAILQVMRSQPAIFLKLLVLLVPRELEVIHSGGVKAMTDEQITSAIEALERMIAAGAGAKVINGEKTPTE